MLANYWHQLGLLLDPGDDNDVETVSAVVRITGGVLGDRAIGADDVTTLASLPPRAVLLARLAGAMKASLTQAAYLFVAPLSQAVRTIDALRQKIADGQPAAAVAEADADAVPTLEG